MAKAIDSIAIIAFAIILTGFVIVPVAFPLAIFTAITGIAIAPWIGSAIAFPLSVCMARKLVAGMA